LGAFNDQSDVDLALPEGTAGVDALNLAARLTERLGCPVDVLWLHRCRFGPKILREGETWATQASKPCKMK
jgi:predicted nucleotidyltransferase